MKHINIKIHSVLGSRPDGDGLGYGVDVVVLELGGASESVRAVVVIRRLSLYFNGAVDGTFELRVVG